VVEQLRARCDAEALSCDRVVPEVKGPDHSVAASIIPSLETLGPVPLWLETTPCRPRGSRWLGRIVERWDLR
jgi:hypothetical protein